ncbi:Three finger toxin [Trichinella pseudospiralis]
MLNMQKNSMQNTTSPPKTNDSSFNSIQVCSFRTHLLETEDESIKKHLNFSCACFAFKEGVQMHQCQSDHSDKTNVVNAQ